MTKSDKVRAREALAIAQGSPVLKAIWHGHLYKRCLDGIADLNRLRQLVGPIEPNKDGDYNTSRGKELADAFENLTIDNVLTVLIGETKPGEWRYDLILDNGIGFGSPVATPEKSREEAEKGIVAVLGCFGHKSKPMRNYEDDAIIRVNGNVYPVPMNDELETFLDKAVKDCMSRTGVTLDQQQVLYAKILLDHDCGVEPRFKIPPVLAAAYLVCFGWTHVSQEIIDGFAAANGVDVDAVWEEAA
jgi:hypothetical protein